MCRRDLPLEFFTRLIWQESSFRADAVGPVTRRWVGPAPSATISESRAEPIRATISRERFWCPFSIRFTAL